MKFVALLPLLGVLLAAVLTMPGCAGTASDTDFRSKVSSASVEGTGGADAAGNVTAGGKVTLNFRDPHGTRGGK